jgi:RHS repeat-associated protein
MQGAGGIGGLVAVFEISNGQISNAHFPCYDGNGNVMALVQTDGTVSVHYEYGPFGEPIRVTGPAAGLNPFRWSTKFTDEESGLVYYGYRYYSLHLGRWITRDPAGEKAAGNLYCFLKNGPIASVDVNGLWGVQFGGFNIGIGDPNLAFDASSWGDVGQGLMACLDGIIPFGNPFGNAGAYDQDDPVLVASRQLGTFARDLLLTAAIPNVSTWAKNPLYYEMGQKALADEVFMTMQNMDAISRASSMIGSQGFLKAFLPALDGNFAAALADGITPGVWMLIGGVAEAADQFLAGEE